MPDSATPPTRRPRAIRAVVNELTPARLDDHERRLVAVEATNLGMVDELRGLRTDLKDFSQELAESLRRQAQDYVPRQQIDQRFAAVADRLADHEGRLNTIIERDSARAWQLAVSIGLALLSAGTGVLLFALRGAAG